MCQTPHNRMKLVDVVIVALFAVILAIVLGAAFCRYALNRSLTWSDEAVRFLFVWFTLIGAAAVLRDRMHIRVEFFVELLSPQLRGTFEKASLALVVLFNVALTALGLIWVFRTAGTSTPAMGWPLNWTLYGALPVGAALAAWFGAVRWRRGEFAESSDAADTSAAGQEESP